MQRLPSGGPSSQTAIEDFAPITNPDHTHLLRRSNRQPKPNTGWGKYHPGATEEEIEEALHGTQPPYDDAAAAVHAIIGEPQTFRQAMSSQEATSWRQACQKEYDGLVAQGTWELVDLPKGRKAIKSKWVFKVRYNADGEFDRFKARLVAKGFTQIQGIDFDETFAPVARLESWRYLIALAAQLDWEVHQIDFDQAYLNGTLDQAWV